MWFRLKGTLQQQVQCTVWPFTQHSYTRLKVMYCHHAENCKLQPYDSIGLLLQVFCFVTRKILFFYFKATAHKKKKNSDRRHSLRAFFCNSDPQTNRDYSCSTKADHFTMRQTKHLQTKIKTFLHTKSVNNDNTVSEKKARNLSRNCGINLLLQLQRCQSLHQELPFVSELTGFPDGLPPLQVVFAAGGRHRRHRVIG